MSRSDLYDPEGGGPAEGCKSICMEGGVFHSDSTVVNSLRELAGETLIEIATRKLDWILGANMDV